MKKEKIIDLSKAEGFHGAEIIDTDKIVFNAAFRPYCEENLCGQYGANYACPPDCGAPEQMKRRILTHKKALVLCTRWEIEDFSRKDKLKEAKSFHDSAMLRLVSKLRAEGHEGIMVGSSGCSLCSPCKQAKGEPCEHPDKMYSCMSAYCIYVKKLAEDCNMSYDYKNKILPFFSMYVFD
ncbi:MAG: DUF2284 domain-containing protein [Clostridia bacterium]|nr:DUF2284 domain-containing protein [Clostridia bacterium]